MWEKYKKKYLDETKLWYEEKNYKIWTKLKNSNCDETLKKIICDKFKSIIETKLNSTWDNT